MTESVLGRKSIFFMLNVINGRRAPILRTKSVIKKQMNKRMAEILGRAGFQPVTSCTKGQYHNR